MKTISAIIMLLALSGCVQKQYVKIPESLTQHCPTGTVTEVSVEGAVNLAIYRKDRLDECNKKLDQIHAIQGTNLPQ